MGSAQISFLFSLLSAGGRKPNWNAIFDALRHELEYLSETGISVSGKVFKIQILSLMADTVAKNSLLGMAGVGATSGCSHCRIEVPTLKLALNS